MICTVHKVHAQSFSAAVVKKLESCTIDSLGSLLQKNPLMFACKELTVTVKGVYEVSNTPKYKDSVKKFGCFFDIVLNDDIGSEAEIKPHLSMSLLSSSFYIGKDNKDFDRYMSDIYLAPKYRQCIIDRISKWVNLPASVIKTP